MEGRGRTAVAILAAGQPDTLFYPGSRIDALSARMDQRVDAQDRRFDQVNGRFDA